MLTFREPPDIQPDISQAWGKPKVTGHYPCGSCVVGKLTSQTLTFQYNNTKIWHLHEHTNCNSSQVICMITCPCVLRYVGQTMWKIKIRICEHRSNMRRGVLTAALVMHYTEKGHTDSDLHWIILHIIKGSIRGGSVRNILYMRKQFWIFTLGTVESGLNEAIDWQALILLQ